MAEGRKKEEHIPRLVCTSAGIVLFLMSFGILQHYQWGQWRHLEQNLSALFPGKLLQEEPET